MASSWALSTPGGVAPGAGTCFRILLSPSLIACAASLPNGRPAKSFWICEACIPMARRADCSLPRFGTGTVAGVGPVACDWAGEIPAAAGGGVGVGGAPPPPPAIGMSATTNLTSAVYASRSASLISGDACDHDDYGRQSAPTSQVLHLSVSTAGSHTTGE